MQPASRDARHVQRRHDAADHGRKLVEACSVQVRQLQRLVRSAEVDGLGLDLLDAAARADRLIVQAVAGLGLIGFSPLGIDRRREGRARARDVGGARLRGRSKQDRGARRGDDRFEHVSLHPGCDPAITPAQAITALSNALMTAAGRLCQRNSGD